MNWVDLGKCLIYDSKDFKIKDSNNKFAIFDLDGTLITAKNGETLKKFHNKPNNYMWLGFESIINTFEELKRNDYIIMIITNQPRLNEHKEEVIKKIQTQLFNKLKWSPYFVINVDSKLQKPSILGFEAFIEFKLAYFYSMDTEKSFYCGDLIGEDDPYPPYRLGDSDTRFAKNLNINLVRPIDLFEHHELKKSKIQEMIICVGNAGSGKSTTAQKLINSNSKSLEYNSVEYVACDTDLMPHWNRKLTIECAKENLEKGKSVIVLATNPRRKDRKEFIDVAKEFDIPYRIVWFIRDGRPFNKYRGSERESKLESTYIHSRPVPEKVYANYSEKFEQPTRREGPLEIVY
jgi:bifunctional polynucleotide phosphatase/kinase